MKEIMRGAALGFGGVAGAGAALVVAGALVAVATRSAVRHQLDGITAKINGLIEQAADAMAQAPDQTRPTREKCDGTWAGGNPCTLDLDHVGRCDGTGFVRDQNHVHSPTCPCPDDDEDAPPIGVIG